MSGCAAKGAHWALIKSWSDVPSCVGGPGAPEGFCISVDLEALRKID